KWLNDLNPQVRGDPNNRHNRRITAPNTSKFLKDLRQFGNGPQCTLAQRALTGCITSCTKSSIIPSTKRSRDSARKFTSLFTSTIPLPSSTTAAAFPPRSCQRRENPRRKSSSRNFTRAGSSTILLTRSREDSTV